MKHVKPTLIITLSALITFALSPRDARAQWIENGVGVCTATDVQVSQTACSDGGGGVIVTWHDHRNGEYDIYAQHIEASGAPIWTIDGVPICTASGHQWYPRIVPDGEGGAIITWHDGRAGNYDIYAQRVDAGGTTLWTANGVALCTDTANQENPRLVSDGFFGAIVTWRDDRGSAYDIYARRVSGAGVPQWTVDGVPICTAADDQVGAVIATDDVGGAIIAWRDLRAGFAGDVYAQHVSPGGIVSWAVNGEPVCTAAQEQEDIRIVSDGSGGAIICWLDLRNASSDVYAQKMNLSGSPDWTTDGVPVCTDSASQDEPQVVSDGYGGAIIAWNDFRNGNWDLYAQRLDISGTAQWTADGITLCDAPAQQSRMELISDGAGGAIVAWFDFRGGGFSDIYAQIVSASGSVQWQANGVPVCMAPNDQNYPTMASDGEGGAIIVWTDKRSGLEDIYAQRMTRQGHWGYPSPWIISIDDVPGDQGGQVRVAFGPSRLDSWPDLVITHYSVWRALSPPEMLSMESYGVGLAGPKQARADLAGKAYYSEAGLDWGLVGTVEANLWPEYGFTADTHRDSTSVDGGMEYFCVSAHGSGFLDVWNSAPDSGYSVDNLSPCTPAAPAAEVVGCCDLHLHWNPNTEVDLHHYAIYRGASEGFVPDDLTRIGTATDTSYVDTGYFGGEYYYKVSAIDVHENESFFALLTPDMIAGTPGERPHSTDALFQNTPNPFPSSTRIGFSIKEAGHVRLRVFDAEGRLVRVLVNEERRPDRYVEMWDGRSAAGASLPSGTYFYVLELPGFSDSKKMTLTR